MTWGEAMRHTRTLRLDPSSAVAAALEGWTNPVSREALILMDHFDLDHAVNSKRTPKPHNGRPWKQGGSTHEHHGDAGGRTAEQVLALLRPPV